MKTRILMVAAACALSAGSLSFAAQPSAPASESKPKAASLEASAQDLTLEEAVLKARALVKKAAEQRKSLRPMRSEIKPRQLASFPLASAAPGLELASYSDSDADCEDDYTCREGDTDSDYCDVNSEYPVACFQEEASVCRDRSGHRQRFRHKTFVGCYRSPTGCARRSYNVAFGCCADQRHPANVTECR